MTKARWKGTPIAPSDRAVQILRAEPGYEGLVTVTDSAGQRVAVAFFATATQAERAQVAASSSVPGDGHATSSPGRAIAWVNYSGKTSVDSKIADCAASARG